MVAAMMLAAVLTAQHPSAHHVRAGDPGVIELFESGMSHSNTFRQLVEILDRSDVIVYVEPKNTRQALGGYLSHNIIVAGAYRYVHIAIESHGSEQRLVPLFAHELQHAVEVSRNPDVRDARAMEQLFSRLALKFGCDGTTCSETQAAKDVESVVTREFAEKH